MIDDPTIVQHAIACVGTPAYLYDLDGIESEAAAIRSAHGSNPVVLNYFEPTNRSKPILQRLLRSGLGITVTRQRGAERALQVGYLPSQIDCSGFALTDQELDFFVDRDIRINLASEWEIARCSREFPRHHFGVRIDLSTEGREKRGIEPKSLNDLVCASEFRLDGLHTYIGTGVLPVDEHLSAARGMADLAVELPHSARESVQYINMGGGFGYDYRTGGTFDWREHAAGIRSIAERLHDRLGRAIEFRFEIGRGLVARHGILLARVLDAYEKSGRRYVVLDVSCSDLPRPIRMGFDKSYFPYMDDGCHRIDIIEPSSSIATSGLEVAVVGNSHYSKDWIGFTQVKRFEPQRLRGAIAIVRDVGAYCEVLRDNWTETPGARSVIWDHGDLREAVPA